MGKKDKAKSPAQRLNPPKAGPHRIRKGNQSKPKYHTYSVKYYTESVSGNEVVVQTDCPTRAEAITLAKSLIRNRRSDVVYVYGDQVILARFVPSDTDLSLKPYPKRDVIPFVTKPVVKVGRV